MAGAIGIQPAEARQRGRRRGFDASADASSDKPRGRAPRLSALKRREDIVSQAAAFFAEAGFAGTTRALAEQLGVRQALLYRYFPSKDALVEAVFQRVTEGRWTQDLARYPRRTRHSAGGAGRAAVYRAYAEQDEGSALRLLMRAALDGLALPARRGAALTDADLRAASGGTAPRGAPALLDRTPLLPAERELAMMLHAAIVQLRHPRAHLPEPSADAARGRDPALRARRSWREPGSTIRALHKRPAPGGPRRRAQPRWSGCGSRG